ncbi:MAG: ribose 5-phosphate isomerase B [archaeon GW2011_AR10]|uniref:Ribose-5-phosphate isomerase B n=1 Tax=Candidatus Iainarchaeum sp. TaxID=3101447 RepID=A0A7J4IYR2_9ARCH|nr:MAG: ribose 5-phosphate isomerase B [archaeon GW2011_AR10]HIH08106.1 ribose 5-phosphate isomerase B [Candidatus Diapherotrites archaeon]
MRVIVGADHAGFRLKEKIKEHLKRKGFEVVDEGTDSEKSCDYPDFAVKVAEKVAKSPKSIGIVVCGTGIGTAMAANKVKGIRAALATNEYMARMAREHNNANVLSLGARVSKEKEALEMVDSFLGTDFSLEERHRRRVKKIDAIHGKTLK